MKSGVAWAEQAAPIVALAGGELASDEPLHGSGGTAAGASSPAATDGVQALERARAFAEPLLSGRPLATGEDAFEQGRRELISDKLLRNKVSGSDGSGARKTSTETLVQ